MLEDVQLALHSDLQPLQSSFPAPELGISAKRVLRACLEQQLQENVKIAQQYGVLPDDEDLAKLPIFQQARHDDAHHIQRSEEEAAAREEARRLAVEEAKRAEAERQRRAAEEAAAEAERKREAKEVRRQARLEAKKEKLKRTRAEEQRRYDELLSRWKVNVEERQNKLDEVKHAIATASEKKAAVQSRLAELTENKTTLLKQLRDLAARGTSGGGGGTTADEVAIGTASAAAAGGIGGTSYSERDRDAPSHRSNLKRPRDYPPQSSYHSSHHHHHHSSPPGKFPREGSYEMPRSGPGIDRERERDIRDREYPPLGPPVAGGGGGGGGGHYSSHSRYGSYSERPGRDYGGGSGYVRRDLSPGPPGAAGDRERGYNVLHPHHHRGGGAGSGGERDGRERGRPSREEFEARERERERGGYPPRPHHDEPRRDGGGGGGGHRPWSGDRR
jgi:hypothetical protein